MFNKSDHAIPTFGELLNKVGRTDHIYRFPRANRIRKSNAEVMITEQIFDATISVFENGFVIYSRNKHETVTAVDRCASPIYAFSASAEEVKEGVGVAGCKCHIIRKPHYQEEKRSYSSVNYPGRNFFTISVVYADRYRL